MNAINSQRDTLTQILDAAELHIRQKGYNDFSFREIAGEIGIKSASVHYHFPTKADLGARVAQRYRERFFDHLGDPKDTSATPEQLLHRYAQVFSDSLIKQQAMCLCGMLGAEVGSLPEPVSEETAHFFDANIAWLTTVLLRHDPDDKKKRARTKATNLLASLEGALILARTLKDVKLFERVSKDTLKKYSN